MAKLYGVYFNSPLIAQLVGDNALASFIRSAAGAVLGTCVHVMHVFMDAIVCVYCMNDYHIA